MISSDTIVAISSAMGPATRMIVRLSGPDALSLARELSGEDPPHAVASRPAVSFNGLSISSWTYAFHAPRSSTGEDVVEFHVPGNPLLVRMLVNHLLARGARSAEPGEFTARAYFNGKMDLSAAEGVAAAIAARSEAQLHAARQLLAGELANRVRPMLDRLAETLALLEVGIDFVDEDVTFLSSAEVATRIGLIVEQMHTLQCESARIEPPGHEPTVALIGRPNAGKSTLLNALAKVERAVVSNVPGTTRDVVSHEVMLRRGPVRLLDAAGVEETETGNDAAAGIAHDMQARTRRAIASVDHVIHVHAADDNAPPIALDRSPSLCVLTKSDLPHHAPAGWLAVSAATGANLDALLQHLDAVCFGSTERRGVALNARHQQHLADAADAMSRAAGANATNAGAEVVALELRHALDELGAIVGSVSPDELLGRVFSRFCIGK